MGICGSLRARSSNLELLRAAEILVSPSARLTIYGELATLPHFNPDLDGEHAIPPVAVRVLRSAVAAADGILISSPEYAHGVPGTLKNALDWLVSGPEVVHKPIGVLNTAPRSAHAHEQLIETLRTMSATIVDGASIDIPVGGRQLDATGIVADQDLSQRLRSALAAMTEAAMTLKTTGG
jgi:NAD(P)H-dependent FMN reductase